MKRILMGVSALSTLLLITGCGAIHLPYYHIDVDNQFGEAAPLSKNDTIRVMIDHKYLDIPPAHQKGWEDWGKFLAAKEETENRLKELGYNVIDTGYCTKDGIHSQFSLATGTIKTPNCKRDDRVANVIVLVDGSRVEGSMTEQMTTWERPLFTNQAGETTEYQTEGEITRTQTWYYKVKIVRPQGKDNPLFKCIRSNDNLDLCVAPEHPANYKTIFSSSTTLRDSIPNPGINMDHMSSAIFFHYPNVIGKKWVYLQGYDALAVVEPNQPMPEEYKTEKK